MSYRLQQMKKLTVTTIKSIQSLHKNTTSILQSSSCKYLCIQQHLLITYHSTPKLTPPQPSTSTNEQQHQNILQIRNIKSLQLIHQSIFKSDFDIVKVCICNGVIGIARKDCTRFYVARIGDVGGFVEMDIHIGFILEVFLFQDCFFTASRDMTIRVWDINKAGKDTKNATIAPVKLPKALKGHKGPITTLSSYHKFLLSGSQDKTMQVWHNNEKWCSYSFGNQVIKIHALPQSSQILVITSDNLLNFITIGSIIQKKICIKQSINIGVFDMGRPICASQIDQSFLVIKVGAMIKFVQVNLRIQIHSISAVQEENNGNICGIWTEGRCMFYGQLSVGLNLVQI